MLFNITWQESCPVLLNPLSIPAPGVLCLSALSLAPVPHLLKAISSISAHRRGERELFRAVQHSCKLWHLCLLFLSRAGMLWKGENCAADDNAEGCSGFCRAFSPFQSHSTVKQWDLVLFQCLGLLPEERPNRNVRTYMISSEGSFAPAPGSAAFPSAPAASQLG